MTLEQLMGLNSRLTAANLQDAYHDIAKKLRLPPAAFPVKLAKACRLNGWTDPAYLLNGSQVALKQIHSLEGVTLDSDYNGAYTIADLLIGNESGEGWGLPDFALLNDSHTVKPVVHWAGSDIICANLDAAFFWITGFAYPYFVSCGSPYNGEHRYDIQWMIDTYGADMLTVDPVLAYPAAERALAIAHQHIGDVVGASALDNLAIQFINYYDRNPESASADLEFGQGSAGGSLT